jgi:hypothetical protein
MVRQVIEQIEQLHWAHAIRLDDPQSVMIEKTLARCLQELRAIIALEVRDQVRRRPLLRIV